MGEIANKSFFVHRRDKSYSCILEYGNASFVRPGKAVASDCSDCIPRPPPPCGAAAVFNVCAGPPCGAASASNAITYV